MLAGNTGYHFQLLTSVIEVNELQKRRVVGKLEKHLGSLIGKRIALLGLAFKPDTDDMREASSLVLAARLQGEGAEVVAYDPVAAERAGELLTAVEMAASAEAALEGADAVVLVTEWPEFGELDWTGGRRRPWRGRWSSTGATSSTPRRCSRPASSTRGSAAPRVAAENLAAPRSVPSIPDASDRPRRRRRDAAAAADQRRPEAGADPGRPALPRLHGRVARRPGVTEVVLACGFLPDVLREALGEEEHLGVRLTYVVEPEPRGTAGAIRFAADSLGERLEDRFLALNGDVLTDLDLRALARLHAERGARATLGLYRVEDSCRLRPRHHRRRRRRQRVPREDRRAGAG